jgi:hypothetical protein
MTMTHKKSATPPGAHRTPGEEFAQLWINLRHEHLAIAGVRIARSRGALALDASELWPAVLHELTRFVPKHCAVCDRRLTAENFAVLGGIRTPSLPFVMHHYGECRRCVPCLPARLKRVETAIRDAVNDYTLGAMGGNTEEAVLARIPLTRNPDNGLDRKWFARHPGRTWRIRPGVHQKRKGVHIVHQECPGAYWRHFGWASDDETRAVLERLIEASETDGKRIDGWLKHFLGHHFDNTAFGRGTFFTWESFNLEGEARL